VLFLSRCAFAYQFQSIASLTAPARRGR